MAANARSYNQNQPPSPTNQLPVKIVFIGQGGGGKSLFGQVLTDGQAPFLVSASANAGTTFPTEFDCDMPTKWLPISGSNRPDPRWFRW
jgi:hypothetical protein